jgi:hypothetical protein
LTNRNGNGIILSWKASASLGIEIQEKEVLYSYNRRIIMKYTLFICLSLILTGCNLDSFVDYSANEDSFDAGKLRMIEQRTGITLPKGTRGLNLFYRGSSIDPAFLAKVEIPFSELDAMANQINKHEQTGTIDSTLMSRVTWWTPRASTVKSERRFLNDGDYVQAYVCKEDSTGIVYIAWFNI